MSDSFFKAGTMLGGAAVIAAAMAVNPATAGDFRHLMRPDKVTSCSSASACIGGSNSGAGIGAYGSARNGDGVEGVTSNPSSRQTGRAGIYGLDQSSDGGYLDSGVYGQSTTGTGVFGDSTNNTGVAGESQNAVGVFAWSPNYIGINAVSVTGTPLVASFGGPGSENAAIEAIGGTSGDPSGESLATYQQNGTVAFWVTNDSNAHVNGLLTTLGSCSSGCSHTRGDRVGSYAPQISTPTIEDVGESRLVGGKARVAIDSALARAVDAGAPYAVFVTPEGDCRGLYVTDKTASGFTVAELTGGRSSVPFSYRIVAKPYGVAAPRLPVITAAQMPHAIKPKHQRVP